MEMNRFGLFFETVVTMLEEKTKKSRESLLIGTISLIITITFVIVLSVNMLYERSLTDEEIENYRILGDALWENGIQDMSLKKIEISSEEECNLIDIYTHPLNSNECKYIDFEITLQDNTIIRRNGNNLIFTTPEDSGKFIALKLEIDYSTDEKNLTYISNFTQLEFIGGISAFCLVGIFAFLIIYFIIWIVFKIIEKIRFLLLGYSETKNEIVENEKSEKTIGQLFEKNQETVRKIKSKDFKS